MLTIDSLVGRGYLGSLVGRPSHRRYTQVYEQIIKPAFGHHLARELTRLHMIRLSQQQIPPEQKRKAIGLIRQGFRWASSTINPDTGELYYEGINPAADLRLKRNPPRERMATTEELTLIMSELPYLKRMRPLHAAFFAIRLAAPCRISELTKAQPRHWTPVQFVQNPGSWWHKPTTKNGTPHTVYVPWQAMQYVHWEGEYCFPGKHGHWSEYTAHTAWVRWMKELKIEHLQLLDIRRTLASYLYKLNRRQEVDDLTIKALLNHYDGRPVAIYTRLDREYLAKILQGYADWLWRLGPFGGA